MPLPHRLILFSLALTSLLARSAAAQEADQEIERVRQTWNGVFQRTAARGEKWDANEFLTKVVAGRHPGKALDIGMGQGRNALFLAESGWDVTGFDLSDEAVSQCKAQAKEAGLELRALQGDINTFDYGVGEWDLVTGMYMHSLLVGQAEAIMRALKPGGILVVEGFHRDLNSESVQGGYFGFSNNELLRVFGDLRVLHYEDLTAQADWGGRWRSGSPIVRLFARKPRAVVDSLRGPALGQEPPAVTPTQIAPGVVNTDAVELNGVFTDNGREFLFTRRVDGEFRMHRMVLENGEWTQPQPLDLLPGSPPVLSVDMTVSANGQQLVWVGPGEKLDLWSSQRIGLDWSTARKLDAPISTEAQEIYPCFVGDGSLYFASNRVGGQGGSDLWRAQRKDDESFATPVNLGPSVNTEHDEADAWISADETILVMASNRPGGHGLHDLYISFRAADGHWSEPKNMGPSFNTEWTDYCPMGTQTGRSFLFSRRNGKTWSEMTEGSIYWVNASALESFRD